MKKKIAVLCCILILIVCVSSISAVSAYHPKKPYHNQPHSHFKTTIVDGDKVIGLNPTHIWYNYTDKSIYLNTSGYPLINIDLDGDHSTATITNFNYWSANYGKYAMVGTVHFGGTEGGTQYFWGESSDETIDQDFCILGEKYVSGQRQDYQWHMRASTQAGDSATADSLVGEWFGFTLQKTTSPSDYVAIIHASDGTNMLPITKPFAYSTNSGATWTTVNP